MNAPQFSADDFDDDGTPDLFVYDRQDRSVFFLSHFLRHEPAWEKILDNVEFTDYLLIRDFDADGRGDLFAGHYNAIRVWKNEAKPGKMARYRLFSNPLKSTYYDNPLNLYCAGIDLPGVEDMDGDGDLDLLVYDVGGTKVEYHRNLALEKHQRLDIFDFELASACWGHFFELYDAQSNVNTLMLHQPPCAGEFKTAHAGGTLLPIQLNGDTLMDLITGDFGVPTVNAVINGGTRRIAHAEYAIHDYPVEHPVRVRYFPGMFYLDVDGNGSRDLVCAPNQPDVSEDYRGTEVWLNAGADLAPAFTRAPRTFLQDQMLDWGSWTNVAPVGDDLLIFFERFGRGAGAEWLRRDETGGYVMDTTNIPEIPAGMFAPVPFAADLNDDGDDDLIVGTGSGKIWTYENLGNGNWSEPYDTLFFVPPNVRYAAPAMADVDGDGDWDAAVGTGRGTLLFYENVGTPKRAVFGPPKENWGGVRVTDSLNTFNGRAAPTFVELDGDPVPELLVGNASGAIRLFDGVSKTDTFMDAGLWTQRRLGVNVRATIAGELAAGDTFSLADSLVWITGTARGGLLMFRTPGRKPLVRDSIPVSRTSQYTAMRPWIWPQPLEDKAWIRTPYPGKVCVFDLAGKKQTELTVSAVGEMDLGFLAPGVYLFRFPNGSVLKACKY
jgi:hypothetical protein